jgi:hypothetical protein
MFVVKKRHGRASPIKQLKNSLAGLHYLQMLISVSGCIENSTTFTVW